MDVWDVLERVHGVRAEHHWRGDVSVYAWVGTCPVCNASSRLWITEADQGPVVQCRSDCAEELVLAALGLADQQIPATTGGSQ